MRYSLFARDLIVLFIQATLIIFAKYIINYNTLAGNIRQPKSLMTKYEMVCYLLSFVFESRLSIWEEEQHTRLQIFTSPDTLTTLKSIALYPDEKFIDSTDMYFTLCPHPHFFNIKHAQGFSKHLAISMKRIAMY